MVMHTRTVAVYKGDNLLVIGKLVECARQLGVKPRTLYFWLQPAYKRRVEARPTSKAGYMSVVAVDD